MFFFKSNKASAQSASEQDPSESAESLGPQDPDVPTASQDAHSPAPHVLGFMNALLRDQATPPNPFSQGHVNPQVIQAVQFSNAENFLYAPAQIAVAPDMMISQASGLVAQSAAGYFDGVSKLALAAQAVLLKQMTENIVKKDMSAAAEDAIGALATDLLVGAAAAVAAAAGAIEAEGASIAIKKIDESIASFSSTLQARNTPR